MQEDSSHTLTQTTETQSARPPRNPNVSQMDPPLDSATHVESSFNGMDISDDTNIEEID